jgi:hypothetical protein
MGSYAEDSKILSNGHVIEHNAAFGSGPPACVDTRCLLLSHRVHARRCTHTIICVRAEAFPRYVRCNTMRHLMPVVDKHQPPGAVCEHCWPDPIDSIESSDDYAYGEDCA